MTRTDFLYARPSFLGGVARTLDLGGTLKEYNQSPDADTADAKALASDWFIVGSDIRTAINDYVKEEEQK